MRSFNRIHALVFVYSGMEEEVVGNDKLILPHFLQLIHCWVCRFLSSTPLVNTIHYSLSSVIFYFDYTHYKDQGKKKTSISY